MATDLAHSYEVIGKFKCQLQDGADFSKPDSKEVFLQMAMKCADVSNPARPFHQHIQWTSLLTEEFYARACWRPPQERRCGSPCSRDACGGRRGRFGARAGAARHSLQCVVRAEARYLPAQLTSRSPPHATAALAVDRVTVNLPKSQRGFIEFVVKPMFDAWSKFLSPVGECIECIEVRACVRAFVRTASLCVLCLAHERARCR